MNERIVMRGGKRDAQGVKVERNVKQEIGFKPNGLWYGIDDSWLEWCEGNSKSWIGETFYKLDVDESRLLRLRPSQLDEFTTKYGLVAPWIKKDDPLFAEDRYYYIDWPRLAREYSGIEIAPYSWNHRMKLMWYYGWDCSSGCIWDPAALRGYEQVSGPLRGGKRLPAAYFSRKALDRSE